MTYAGPRVKDRSLEAANPPQSAIERFYALNFVDLTGAALPASVAVA